MSSLPWDQTWTLLQARFRELQNELTDQELTLELRERDDKHYIELLLPLKQKP